jgi:hypothetical protein
MPRPGGHCGGPRGPSLPGRGLEKWKRERGEEEKRVFSFFFLFFLLPRASSVGSIFCFVLLAIVNSAKKTDENENWKREKKKRKKGDIFQLSRIQLSIFPFLSHSSLSLS